MTITTPRGHKVRTQTRCAFVLIRETETGAQVLKRSDNLLTLDKMLRKVVRLAGIAHYVASTRTGGAVNA
jgi:hypothetical protein